MSTESKTWTVCPEVVATLLDMTSRPMVFPFEEHPDSCAADSDADGDPARFQPLVVPALRADTIDNWDEQRRLWILSQFVTLGLFDRVLSYRPQSAERSGLKFFVGVAGEERGE